ncbi:arginine repressor [uncultured Bifidobacterium sp.]|uniref:arginine repressor n=1 Tax=uncultured Bifidobacterium sp. TaxID=165187 RepID=UPI00260B538C|nr:arginine repressor [uncultured Bifidobacterium sp.]
MASIHRPTTRAARLSAIEQVLLSRVITSQSQLSDVLADLGIEVTQATLSRDLDEINASKTRLPDGTIAYAVARNVVASGAEERMRRVEQQMSRVISGLVTSVASARNLVVIHTPSGAAQYVASVIDGHPIVGILGTIAGDDTVMMVCSDDDEAERRVKWLLDVASRSASSDDGDTPKVLNA